MIRNTECQRLLRDQASIVARALRESEPAAGPIGRHVATSGQLPRIPAVGLEPGAIRGTMPHRSRCLR